MPDQSLTAKVVVAFKGSVKTNGNKWKDHVDIRLTIGRRAERRTVQGGGLDVLPAEIISSGEFEVPLSTDILEIPTTPIDPNSLSFWMEAIVNDGAFPLITIIKESVNQVPNTATLTFTARVTEIVPGDKAGEDPAETYIVRFIPVTHTSFIRSA